MRQKIYRAATLAISGCFCKADTISTNPLYCSQLNKRQRVSSFSALEGENTAWHFQHCRCSTIHKSCKSQLTLLIALNYTVVGRECQWNISRKTVKKEEERNTRLCDTFIMKYYLRIAMKGTEFMAFDSVLFNFHFCPLLTSLLLYLLKDSQNIPNSLVLQPLK